jgi:hypothetical protein
MVKLVAQTPLFFALFALGARLLRYATLTRPARRAKNTTSRIRGGMKIKERLSKHPLAAAVVSFFAFTVLIGLLLGAILGPLKCRDGWASPSIGQSGACSWHGGVDRNRGALNTLLSLAGAFGVFLWCVPIRDWRCHCGPIYPPPVSGGCAGREPAGMASVTGLVDRWRRHHEVSMLTAVMLSDDARSVVSVRTGPMSGLS